MTIQIPGDLFTTGHMSRGHGSELIVGAQILKVLDVTACKSHSIKSPGQIGTKPADLTTGSGLGPIMLSANLLDQFIELSSGYPMAVGLIQTTASGDTFLPMVQILDLFQSLFQFDQIAAPGVLVDQLLPPRVQLFGILRFFW